MARVWDKFLTERDKQHLEISGWGSLAAEGARPQASDHRGRRLLPRRRHRARADLGAGQDLAGLLRPRGLGGDRPHRRAARGRPPGRGADRLRARRHRGGRAVEPGRQGRDAGAVRRAAGDRLQDRQGGRAAAGRPGPAQADGERVRRHAAVDVPQPARHRHRARGGRDDQRLRAGHRARRGRFPVQDRRGRGVLLRPDRGGARDQPVRHAPQVRRRDQPRQRDRLPADRIDRGRPSRLATESEVA